MNPDDLLALVEDDALVEDIALSLTLIREMLESDEDMVCFVLRAAAALLAARWVTSGS